MRVLTKGILCMVAFSFSNTCLSLSLKTHREFYESLLKVTNVTPGFEIYHEYFNVRPILSQTTDINDFGSPMQIGLLRLSGLVCHARIELDRAVTETELRWMHKTFNFSLEPKNVTESMWQSVVQEYARLLWQRSSTTEEAKIFSDWLMSAAQGSKDGVGGNVTLLGNVCSFMATSPAVFVR